MKSPVRLLSFASIVLLLAVSCKGRQLKSNYALIDTKCQITSKATSQSDSLKPVVYDKEIADSYYSGPYKIARYFGWENGQIEESSLPDIPGMVYRTGSGKHIGLRCPNESVCLDWTSNRIRRFADWCKNGPADTIPETTSLYRKAHSYQDTCEHYINKIADSRFVRSEPRDKSTYIEQFAVLLIDVHQTDKYVTMQEYTWYDCCSCGDNTTLSWYTIELRSGRQLSLSDIIDESQWQKFAYIMIQHLVNACGTPWLDHAKVIRNCDLIDYLMQCDGCALVPEGVVVFYHPYNIGCGAEGQYNSLIPYDELKGMLIVD